MSQALTHAPDLTKRPPRSPRVRLGGYALLPRMLDKGRAELAGTAGEFHFACPLDQRFLQFVGLDAEAVKEQLAAGLGDGEMLKWIEANATKKREDFEILTWSQWQNERVPSELEVREFFHKMHQEYGPERGDIATWPDLLDLDDYVTFGGKA